MWKKVRDSKWFYVALSILMSVVLWVYVMNVANPDKANTVRGIPVTFVGTDVLATRNLMITEGSSQTFDLGIKTKLDLLNKLNRETISIKVDVSKITEPGEHKISFTPIYPSTIAAGSVETTTDPTELYVTVHVAKMGNKEIPVQVEFTGTPAKGYQLGEPSVTPSIIGISGQSDVINQVVYAKIELPQKDLADTYTGDLSFVYMGSDGQELDGDGITSNVDTVHVIYPVVKVKDVTLNVDLIPGGGATAENAKVTIEPASISVAGAEETLEGLNELVIGQVDLSQVITSGSYSFPIKLSEGLSNETGVTEAKVTITIEGLATKELDVDNIQYSGVPDGFTPLPVTLSRTVMVRGPKEAVDLVFAAQLRIVADASAAAATEGRYTVPAKVYLDGSGEVGVIGTYNIVIELTREAGGTT